MENIDSTNIDNLYRAGLAHYAEALFAARHFEYLIYQSSINAFDEELKGRLINALGGQQLKDSEFYSWSPKLKEVPTKTLKQWAMWVTHKYWVKEPGISLHIGYSHGLNEKSYAMIAMDGMKATIRKQITEALVEHKRVEHKSFIAHSGEGAIIIALMPLSANGTQNDFIEDLQKVLNEFIQFLEHKNQQTPNWITTLV